MGNAKSGKLWGFGLLTLVIAVTLALWLPGGRTSGLSSYSEADGVQTAGREKHPAEVPAITKYVSPQERVYVVDNRNGELSSQILVVDVANAQVVESIPTRYQPDLAVGQNALYVVDSYSPNGIDSLVNALTLVSSQDGQIRRDVAKLPDRLLYQRFPRESLLALSPDGKRLYYRQAMSIGVVDAQTFAPEPALAYPDCEPYGLQVGNQVAYVICGNGTIVAFDATTGKTARTLNLTDFYTPATRPANIQVQGAVLWGDRLAVIDNTGNLVSISNNSPTANSVVNLGQDASWEVADPTSMAVSPDGMKMYVSFSKKGDSSGKNPQDSGSYRSLAESAPTYGLAPIDAASYEYLAQQIWVYDTQTWKRIGVIQPSKPIFTFALSQDGQRLYGVNPFQQTLLVIQTADGSEESQIPLGVTPSLVVPAPSVGVSGK